MVNLRKWSQTATGNASVAGGANTINFAEGQTPGSVNNSAREMMAQVRKAYVPSEWGWVEHSATASVASQTTFKIAGDNTSDYTAGRRWRLKSGSSTRYGSVVSSSYTVETTVTVTVDSGSLSASHSLVAISPIDNVNNQLAGVATDSAGRVGIGTRSPTLAKVQVNASSGDGVLVYDGSAVQNIHATSGGTKGTFGTVSNHAIGLFTNSLERLQIDTSGNVRIITSGAALGYATGSGGTVTQITSKSTTVTLNRGAGQIVTHNASLAANTTVAFTVSNTVVASTDTIIIHRSGGGSDNSYLVWIDRVAAGAFDVYLKNITAAPLAEAVTLNFAIIKAVTS